MRVTSIMEAMLHLLGVATVVIASIASLSSQTPQPFPRAGSPAPTQAPRTPAAPLQTPPPTAAPPPADPNVPGEATLGTQIFPAAQFLSSYDAGGGQRYYLFGVAASFAEVVSYYQTLTGERGELIFKEPPTHQFHGEPFVRYRAETMVFAPGVTVKDWTSGGSQGYPNPKRGAQPARFPTILMIVTPPANSAAPRR